MKVAAILILSIVMVMSHDPRFGRYWRRRFIPAYNRFRTVEAVKSGVRTVVGAVGSYFGRWGKREVRNAEFDAAFNAAAEDGVLSDDEIQSVLGVSVEELSEFIENVDMDGNGEISVAEYIVATIAAEEGQQ